MPRGKLRLAKNTTDIVFAYCHSRRAQSSRRQTAGKTAAATGCCKILIGIATAKVCFARLWQCQCQKFGIHSGGVLLKLSRRADRFQCFCHLFNNWFCFWVRNMPAQNGCASVSVVIMRRRWFVAFPWSLCGTYRFEQQPHRAQLQTHQCRAAAAKCNNRLQAFCVQNICHPTAERFVLRANTISFAIAGEPKCKCRPARLIVDN